MPSIRRRLPFNDKDIVTRTPKEIVSSLYGKFEQSSQTFVDELNPHFGPGGPLPKQYVDAALSAFAAAIGPDQKDTLAVAGLTPERQGETQECELVVLTDNLLLHTAFRIAGSARPVVNMIRRDTIKSLTITDAPSYEKRDPSTAGLKFTVEYENGLGLTFPLKGNTPNFSGTLGEILDAVREDLQNSE